MRFILQYYGLKTAGNDTISTIIKLGFHDKQIIGVWRCIKHDYYTDNHDSKQYTHDITELAVNETIKPRKTYWLVYFTAPLFDSVC